MSNPRCLAGLVASALLAGCSGAAPADDGALSTPETTGQGVVVQEFVAHLSPKNRSLTFKRVKHASTTPGLSPQDLNADGDALTIDNDGTEGSGSTNTVELVTNSVGEGVACPAPYVTDSFCGNVTLRHFYGQSIDDVFVQVTAIKDDQGSALTGHAGENSSASEFGLDNTLGLWKYGTLGQDPFNAASLDWVFANPDEADTDIVLKVVGAMSYTSYARGTSPATFIDACGSMTGSSSTSSSSTQSMPFPFTFWDQTSSSVTFTERGVVTFGGVSNTASGTNVCLPDMGAPAPGLFAFWDDLTLGSGTMCWDTVGSAPNRQFVIEWSGVDFASDDDPMKPDMGSSLTFEAILSEGTNTIDLVYDTMSAPMGSSSTRTSGTSATVGVQDATGSSAPDATCTTGNYSAGHAYRFTPTP